VYLDATRRHGVLRRRFRRAVLCAVVQVQGTCARITPPRCGHGLRPAALRPSLPPYRLAAPALYTPQRPPSRDAGRTGTKGYDDDEAQTLYSVTLIDNYAGATLMVRLVGLLPSVPETCGPIHWGAISHLDPLLPPLAWTPGLRHSSPDSSAMSRLRIVRRAAEAHMCGVWVSPGASSRRWTGRHAPT